MKVTWATLPTTRTVLMRIVLLIHRQRVLDTLTEQGLRDPILFGSVARGDARLGSDFDLAVTGMSPAAFATLSHTRDLLSTILGAEVSLSQVEALRAQVASEVARDGVRLQSMRWRDLLNQSHHVRGA
ncbi:nucleotidyltransferase family protein [Nocardioides sp. NPDC087217]|uniref:nucleotidyltransferase family protein n=1 Tax=Nocardioides sp. NPDC087217 TaxID=3364335 RepID=UPI0038061EBC